MSVQYRPVQWTRVKVVYDLLALVVVAIYIALYQYASRASFQGPRALSPAILSMRAYGSCAYFLLTLILSIGPLARLEPRLLPLLYNRRHLGVAMAGVALAHALSVLGFYFAWGKDHQLVALLRYDQPTARSFPFLVFGLASLAIVVVMAATSHDFWQRFLGPTVWKRLHMSVYLAYSLAVLHVTFGALQRERHPVFVALTFLLPFCVAALHVAAALRSRDAPGEEQPPWVDAGRVDELLEGHARTVCPRDGERIALVRKEGRLYAVHGLCAHQRGPLSEGRIVGGCLTCPWHGWQYRVEDGRSPPPFEEVIPTYRLRRIGARVQVDPRPLPLGVRAEPIAVARAPHAEEELAHA